MLRALVTRWKRHSEFLRTYKELSKLSTRELRDIGLERSMITRISLEATYREDELNA